MIKFILGFVLGIVVSVGGFSFTTIATYLDQGVEYVKEASAEAEKKIEKKVDKP